MAKLTFKSHVDWSGEGVRGIAQIRDKQIIIDEPSDLGGTDQGPNPVELILAALGGCLNVLVSMHAKKHGVELNGVKIEVEGDLDPDGFLEKVPGVRPGFQEIRYRVTIDSPSPADQIQSLLEHVERICPVKDTLRGVPTFAIPPAYSGR
ncbi:MAG: OsmC family protein [Candidatus Carbobacillus altaicus]|uniref:OsmC family protein n=1 Tax=Candidatus Carbonibacillus altaicus TaxID=2163959 RepID=A0A2R6XZL8_9BACL|nr:MAG: OsmC family protein [Candidatus Carbobacillus altaicus]